jgi:hypothetical protein
MMSSGRQTTDPDSFGDGPGDIPGDIEVVRLREWRALKTVYKTTYEPFQVGLSEKIAGEEGAQKRGRGPPPRRRFNFPTIGAPKVPLTAAPVLGKLRVVGHGKTTRGPKEGSPGTVLKAVQKNVAEILRSIHGPVKAVDARFFFKTQFLPRAFQMQGWKRPTTDVLEKLAAVLADPGTAQYSTGKDRAGRESSTATDNAKNKLTWLVRQIRSKRKNDAKKAQKLVAEKARLTEEDHAPPAREEVALKPDAAASSRAPSSPSRRRYQIVLDARQCSACLKRFSAERDEYACAQHTFEV